MTPEQTQEYDEGFNERQRDRVRVAAILGLLTDEIDGLGLLLLEHKIAADPTVREVRWRLHEERGGGVLLSVTVLEAVEAMTTEQKISVIKRMR